MMDITVIQYKNLAEIVNTTKQFYIFIQCGCPIANTKPYYTR